MIVLRDPATVTQINDAALRSLLTQRFQEISQDEPYDPDVLGYFVVVEPVDSVEALETATGCSILHGRFGVANFGDQGFVPAFEFMEEHPSCFEMAFIISDDGFGIELFVPKLSGINPQLLALCAAYGIASPALTTTAS